MKFNMEKNTSIMGCHNPTSLASKSWLLFSYSIVLYRSRKFAWTLWINVLNLPLKGFKKQIHFFCLSKKLPTPTPPPNPSMLGSMDFWRIHKVDPGIPLLRDTHFGQFDEAPIIVPIFLDLVFCHPKPLSSRALPIWNSGYPHGTNISPTKAPFEDDFPFPLGGIC